MQTFSPLERSYFKFSKGHNSIYYNNALEQAIKIWSARPILVLHGSVTVQCYGITYHLVASREEHKQCFPICYRTATDNSVVRLDSWSQTACGYLRPGKKSMLKSILLRTQLRDFYFTQKTMTISWLYFDVSWCNNENVHSFEWNQDRITGFLRCTDFSLLNAKSSWFPWYFCCKI